MARLLRVGASDSMVRCLPQIRASHANPEAYSLTLVRLEVFQWRLEIVVNLDPPFGDAKATNRARRSDANEASNGHITVGEDNLLTRTQALKQLSDRANLFHVDRPHLPSVAV